MTDTIDSKKKNCTLVAVREVSRLPDDVILAAFRKRHYKENQGMFTHNWIGAAKDLGLKIEEVKFERVGLCEDDQGRQYPMRYQESPTLAQFIRENPFGTFFITVPSHALVVRDGRIIDPNYRSTNGTRRKVRCVHKVLNAPAIEAPELSEFVYIPKWHVKRRGTAAWDRWISAWHYLQNNKNVTIQQLIANTTYTEADFKHDIRKNLLAYKPKEK